MRLSCAETDAIDGEGTVEGFDDQSGEPDTVPPTFMMSSHFAIVRLICAYEFETILEYVPQLLGSTYSQYQ